MEPPVRSREQGLCSDGIRREQIRRPDRRSDGQWFTPSAGLSYWFSTWNGIDADLSYTRGLYEGDNESNFDNYDGRARFNHRHLQRVTGVYGEYHQIYRKWDDPSDTYTDGGQLQQDYLVYAPSVGVFHEFDPTLKGLAGRRLLLPAGQERRRPEGALPLQSEHQQALGFSALERAAEGGRAALTARTSSGDQQGFERYRPRQSRSGRYNFTREFFGDLGVGRYRYSDYMNSEDDEKDFRDTLDVGLGYTVTRWATVRVGYTFNKLDAISSTEDYVQNVGLRPPCPSPRNQPWRIFELIPGRPVPRPGRESEHACGASRRTSTGWSSSNPGCSRTTAAPSWKTFHRDRYAKNGVATEFCQDNVSISRKGTVRGLHYQHPQPQAKLVQVLQGEVVDVAVDIRRGSPTFGRSVTAVLSEANHRQMFIPEGFAHGFYVTSESALFVYKCSQFYAPDCEGGVLWCDPDLAIPWPVNAPLLSPKDQRLPRLADISTDRLPVYLKPSQK